jgi:hypothetical protein
MVPDADGLDLSISLGQVVTKQVSYDLADHWVFDNLDVVAFVQCDDEHRVMQAAKFNMAGANISVYPSGSLVAPLGGTLEFNTSIVNHSDNPVSGDFWLSVRLPDMTEVVIPEALLNYDNPLQGQVTAWNSLELFNELRIPSSGISTGMYTVVGKIGRYPDVVLQQSSFDFLITE